MLAQYSLVSLVASGVMLGDTLYAQDGVKLGDEVPPITLEAITNAPEGTSASWEAFGDKVVVLEFWGTW